MVLVKAGGVVEHSEVKQTWGGAARGILHVRIDVGGAPPAIAAEDKRQD